MPLLDVTSFSKRFYIHQLSRDIPVFEGVEFTLDAGEFLLVAGPNGVGKSTLLRCLYRTYLPSGGSAWFDAMSGPIDLASATDIDIARLRQTEIGHVTQFLRPRPRVSALALVMEPLWLAGVPIDQAQAVAEQLLDSFGLKRAIWDAYPTTFSGGEQQKVNLARALAVSRRLLLLDEPTASLDLDTRHALISRLRALRQDGVAMIGVFHHPDDIRPLVDRELVMRPADKFEPTVELEEENVAT